MPYLFGLLHEDAARGRAGLVIGRKKEGRRGWFTGGRHSERGWWLLIVSKLLFFFLSTALQNEGVMRPLSSNRGGVDCLISRPRKFYELNADASSDIRRGKHWVRLSERFQLAHRYTHGRFCYSYSHLLALSMWGALLFPICGFWLCFIAYLENRVGCLI